MADFPATDYLVFTATDDGTTLTPTTAFGIATPDYSVVDSNADDNIDSVDYFAAPAIPYSGYTISINGNPYAVFFDGGTYVVPFDSAFDDLTPLFATPVTQPIRQSGDDVLVVNCFVTGTLIATPKGERTIETLVPGDLVTLADGSAAPIRWVARQEIAAEAVNLSLPEDRLPIRIDAGAFGQGMPHTDLTVSAGHGMVLDGLLINASALVNGQSIRFLSGADMPERFSYWHIELDHHAVLLANGAPTESLVDYCARSTYDNYAEYIDMYGAEPVIAEMDLPRVSARRLVPADLRARLNGSAQPERMAG